VGSIVYAFVRMAGFLREPALLAAARDAACALTCDAIEADDKYEVFWGTAGALLGLLALGEAAPTAGVDEAVRRCAEHLLAHRVPDPESGHLAWATYEAAPVAGFAHGSTGIAHALLQLHRRAPDPRLYEAAVAAFAFERTAYREDLNEWLDARGQEERILSAWCHGSAGIGFSRLSALGLVRPEDDAAIAADLVKALRKVNTRQLLVWDNICCGNFGRVDFLVTAGRRLQNPSLEEAAYRIAGLCLDRAGEDGFRTPGPDEGPQFTPGLWQGTGGIGYVLLRLAAPERFPSLLWFE
jgi:lantibiotic modifying enzyme